MASQSFGVIGLDRFQKWKWNSGSCSVGAKKNCGGKGLGSTLEREGRDRTQSLKPAATTLMSPLKLKTTVPFTPRKI
jgi:hypothetical protein